MFDDLFKNGFRVVDCSGEDGIAFYLNLFKKLGMLVTRDVVVSTELRLDALRATNNDFWFHSDGTFLDLPPEWVIVEILKSEGGGSIEILDTYGFIEKIKPQEYLYGNAKHRAPWPVKCVKDRATVIRYRRDYMSVPSAADEKSLALLHTLIQRHAGEAISLGEIPEGHAIILNNWRFLHRRHMFNGERSIRRIWLNKR